MPHDLLMHGGLNVFDNLSERERLLHILDFDRDPIADFGLRDDDHVPPFNTSNTVSSLANVFDVNGSTIARCNRWLTATSFWFLSRRLL